MPGMAHDLFHVGIPLIEKAVRTVGVYALLLVLLRLAGKRELAQLNSFDLVVLLLLSNVVQNAVIGNDSSLAGGALGAVILVAANFLVVRYAFFHPRFGRTLQGGATTLVEDSKTLDDVMRRELISRAQLDAALRREGIEDGVDGVQRVVLEPEGTFTPTPKRPTSIDEILAALDRIERKLG
jgi:uncharacterized membrane protein YcaP (DUF421 family)